MSFWPFPKTLLDELSTGLALGPGVELGSGDGRLRDRLGVVGVPLIAADLVGSCDVRLDATRLPLQSDAFGLVVAGNLMRHLDASGRQRLLRESARVLRNGGRLLLLEDDPQARNPAELNYRRTLELLARVDTTRGAALDLTSIVADRPADLELNIWSETLENEEQIQNVFAPLDWLVAQGRIAPAELEAQRAEVARHGMQYGRFQVCLLERAQRENGS